MTLHISGGNLPKPRRLNPYRRITRGTTINCLVGGHNLEVIVDQAGKYTYLAVDGVDYYVTGALEEGKEYKVEDVLTKEQERAANPQPPRKPGRPKKQKQEEPVAEAA